MILPKRKRLTAIKNDQSKPIELSAADIGFLIDDSASILDPHFELIKVAVEEAINICKIPNSRFFIIAFSTAPSIISGPTDKKQDIILNMNKFQRKKGKTNTHLALKTSLDMFVRGDVTKRLYVLTDGDPEDSKEVKTQSTLLKNRNVEIIGIGIGNQVKIEKMKEWCSLDRTYPVSEFSKIKEVFLKNFDMKYDIPEYEVRLVVTALDYPIGFGEDLQLEIELTNVGEKEIPANTSVKVIGNDYFDSIPVFFRDPIEIDGKTFKKVRVPSKGQLKAILLPEYLEFGVHHKSVTLHCIEKAFKLFSEFFIKNIIEVKTPLEKIPYLNILCFGVAGSGKSSFINSLMTALNDDIVRVAAVGGNINHVTTALTRFAIKDLDKDNFVSVPINLFDIWGMDADNFQNNMFLDVLKGKLPEGYEMKDRTQYTADIKEEILKEANWNQTERTIHSVIFMMPYNIDDNPKFTEALAENFRICTKDNKMNPIVVITRASYEGDQSAQEELRLRISGKFNIPPNQIFMFDNYTTQTEKTMSIDKKTLEILTHTINSAIYYQKFYKNTLLSNLIEPPIVIKKQSSPIKQPPPQDNYELPTEYPNSNTKNPVPQKNEYPTPQPFQFSGNDSQSSGLTCKKCHEEVEADWETCPTCTTPIERPRPLNISNSSNTCACGKPLKPNWKYCPYCKRPVPVAVVGPKKCVCGEEIEDESWEVCPVCEAYLIRPSICCNVHVRPNFLNCPKCKKIFPK